MSMVAGRHDNGTVTMSLHMDKHEGGWEGAGGTGTDFWNLKGCS